MLAMHFSIIGRTASAIESSRSRMSTKIVTWVRWPVGPAQRAVGAGLLAFGLAGVLWCVQLMDRLEAREPEDSHERVDREAACQEEQDEPHPAGPEAR